MPTPGRKGALIAGFILIVIGSIFLIENVYGAFPLWRLVFRYWPLILIVIGVSKLYGYFTWQETLPPAPEIAVPPVPPIEIKD